MAGPGGRAAWCWLLVLLAETGLGWAQPQPRCEPLLEDRAAAAGIDFRHERGASARKHQPETMGSGLAWIDFDFDGWQDLYLVQSGSFPPDGGPGAANRLYRNRGDGSFRALPESAGAGDRGYGQGAVAADVDGDGDTDLYVTNYGRDALLVNRGDGSFEDRSAAAGLGLDGWSSSAAFADADADGDLDLYVTRYIRYDPSDPLFCGDRESGQRSYCHPTLFEGAGDRFFRNLGDGRFEDRTSEAGLAGADGRGLGVVFTDLDGDQRPDLYVANDLNFNLLFRNRGDGSFEDFSLISGAAVNAESQPEAGMGVAVGDLDLDGDPDLVVTNFDVETNTHYRNLGGLQFEDVSAASGVGLPSFNLLGFGVVLTDLDLDADLDLYVANGHILERPGRDHVSYAQPDLVLLGDGSGRVLPPACAAVLAEIEVGRGAAAADYDNDGDPDLAVQTSGGSPQLLHNRARGRWVGVDLRGRAPNTGAVGARVALAVGAVEQVRWSLAGESYQSSGDRRVLFGWPQTAPARVLEVTWPSGERQRFVDPPPERYLVVGEPR